MHITVIGAGIYGTALAKILTRNFHTVQFFDPKKYPVRLKTALKNSHAILLATPSAALPDLLPRLPADRPIICASKGLIDPKLLENLPHFSALAGPAFAKDLNRQKPTTLTITSTLAGRLLAAPFLSFQYTSDLHGVLLCSTLKNLYAVSAGAQNLQPGSRAFLNFISTAHRETLAALKHLGHQPATAHLSCGIDDLILTCSSPNSRNYRLGQSIRAHTAPRFIATKHTVESLTSAYQWQSLLQNIPQTPLLHDTIDSILNIPLDTTSPAP